MHYGPVENRPTGGCRPARASREQLLYRLHPFRADMLVGSKMQQLTVESRNEAVGRTAQPHGLVGDGIEDRLNIGRRLADHAQELGGRRLLLERLLRVVEQPHVLDRDDGLVGEGLHQGDLAVGERQHLVSDDVDDSLQLAGPEHRHGNQSSEGAHLSRAVGVLGIGTGIEDLDRALLQGSTTGAASPSRLDRILLLECSQLRRDVVGGHHSQHLPVEPEDQRVLALAQLDGVLGHRLEHRLQIEGGLPDHLEELAGRRLLFQCFCQ